jgi:hypothetical protein
MRSVAVLVISWEEAQNALAITVAGLGTAKRWIMFWHIGLVVLLSILADLAKAQTPADDDPMTWAYDYAYARAICDSSTAGERAMPLSDASVSCQQAAAMKEFLKRQGYWCVTNVVADFGEPCTPGLAKTPAR